MDRRRHRVPYLPTQLSWNVHHDWPFVQLMHNIHQSGRDVQLSPARFFLQQVGMVNPFAFPLWIAGLLWLFFGREGRKYRVLGWAYVVTFAVLAALHGKDYYLAPAYPMLFAAGSVACEKWLEAHPRLRWLKPAFVLLLVVPFLALLPIFAPVISVERYVAFQKAIHYVPPISEHSHARSPLPQYYSDELGWEAMVAEVARVYRGLPADIQAKTGIKANDYGQAGAIDYFGPKYGLPKAICEHQNMVLGDARLYRRKHDPHGRGRSRTSGADYIARGESGTSNIPTRWKTSTSINKGSEMRYEIGRTKKNGTDFF